MTSRSWRWLAYVVIEHGTLSEQHVNDNGTWATAFPTADGVFQLLPQFTVGGVYPPPNPPSCN